MTVACAALRVAASLAVRPGAVLRRGAGLVAELGQVGLGTSAVAPPDGDGRFAGRHADPVRRRLVQTYLAATGTLSGLLDDADVRREDADRLRAAFAPLSALVVGVPAAAPVPERTPAPGPVPGRDVAATPGAVVLRTPMFELLQYLPRTEQVRDVPVLIVPPFGHRYWLADLAPGHSLVEYLVGAGQQVFALSWSGPGPDGSDLDTFAAAVLDAIEACTRITRCPRVTPAGIGTGGLLVAAVQAHLAATGRDDRVAAAVHLGTTLDPDTDGTEPDRLPDGPARRALRHWSADRLPVPASLHAGLAGLTALAADHPGRPGTVLGTRVEPRRLTRDAYLVAAADGPEQGWTAGHRTARVLGGRCRLVLAPGGRAGALVAAAGGGGPDGFRSGPVEDGTEPGRWRAESAHTPGSWWPDLAGWLAERSGAVRDAPPELGGRRMYPVEPAPGAYVRS